MGSTETCTSGSRCERALYPPSTLVRVHCCARARGRWAAETALALASAVDPSSPALPLFQDVVLRLAPCPVDNTTGSYMIAQGVPFAVPHRHYSHLLSVYDLGTSGVDHMAPSVDLWWNITCAAAQAEWPNWQGDCECR